MGWSVEELVRWLDAVEPALEQRDPFTWLELTPWAAHADVQPAFHAVARNRHPDLYRVRLAAADLDRLVRVYSRIAAAYAELRDPARYEVLARTLRVGRPRPVNLPRTATSPQVPRTATSPQVPRTATSPQVPRTATSPQVPRTATAPQVARTATPPPQVARTTTARSPSTGTTPPPDGDRGAIDPSRAMNPRALAYYRRAEGALRVGDHVTALLQLRMAVASDPSSTLLRAALAELLSLVGR